MGCSSVQQVHRLPAPQTPVHELFKQMVTSFGTHAHLRSLSKQCCHESVPGLAHHAASASPPCPARRPPPPAPGRPTLLSLWSCRCFSARGASRRKLPASRQRWQRAARQLAARVILALSGDAASLVPTRSPRHIRRSCHPLVAAAGAHHMQVAGIRMQHVLPRPRSAVLAAACASVCLAARAHIAVPTQLHVLPPPQAAAGWLPDASRRAAASLLRQGFLNGPAAAATGAAGAAAIDAPLALPRLLPRLPPPPAAEPYATRWSFRESRDRAPARLAGL